MKNILLLLSCVLLFFSCSNKQNMASEKHENSENTMLSKATEVFEIINIYDIVVDSFIQGLYYKDKQLYISTGLDNHSTLRIFDLATKSEVKRIKINNYFCEGIAEIGGKIFQLTWQDEKCLVYDAKTLKKITQYDYEGEGWGICTDGKSLIMSDGSEVLKYMNPANFLETKRIKAKYPNGFPVYNLNELEFIDGKIWANVWTFDKIVVIDPNSGMVEKEYDMRLLRDHVAGNQYAEVLNGIAYNTESKTYYITGKNWGKIFEVKFNN